MSSEAEERRIEAAQQIIAAGFRCAVDYLQQAGDPRPRHTAAQAIWREAIETTAQALKPANDTMPLKPLFGDEGD